MSKAKACEECGGVLQLDSLFRRALEWGAGALCKAKGCDECGGVLQHDSIVLAHFGMGGRSSVLNKRT
jgi:hypothetical protein